MTGMREQEVMYTYWSDINLAASTVRLSRKADRGWTPKAYEEREIPTPSKLVKSLKEWRKKPDKNCDLVFPTAGCNPKLDFLDGLKAVAERAELDKENFWLHKFRATFAPGRYGLALICAPCSSGSVIPTWRARCGI